MASIADQLISSGLQTSQQAPDIKGAVESGVGIAQTIENVQRNRELLEQKKQELHVQKIGKLIDAMEAVKNLPSAGSKNAYLKYYIPKVTNALGLQDFVPPETMEMIKADPDQVKKFGLLKAQIQNGSLTYEQAVSKMDPEEWANMSDKDVQQLDAAEKFRTQQEGLEHRASMFAGAAGSPKEHTLATNDLQKFGAEVANPTTRRALGNHKQIIDATDRVKGLSDQIGMGRGEFPPKDESEPQYISRLNKATSQQVEEVVKVMDNILSTRGQQTVSGAEHLRPVTYEGLVQKYGERISGVPAGLGQGKFLELALDSIDRERKIAVQKRNEIANSLKTSYPRAAKYYNKEMDEIINSGGKQVNAQGTAANGASKIAAVADSVRKHFPDIKQLDSAKLRQSLPNLSEDEFQQLMQQLQPQEGE